MKQSKIIRSILSIFLALSFCVPTEAFANAYVPQSIEEINRVNASKYALSFVEAVCHGSSYDSGKVISFLGEDNRLAGYCVDILNNGNPNGYVVIKFADNQPVVSEYCLESGANNPYKDIIERNGIEETSNIFYSVGANEYQVYAEEERAFIGFDNEKISIAQFEEYKSEVQAAKLEVQAADVKIAEEFEINAVSASNAGLAEKQIVYSSVDNKTVITNMYEGTVKEQAYIPGGNMAYYCQNDVYDNGLYYACAVVALCNMMKYLKSRGFTKISSDFKTLYNELWKYSGTVTLNDENGRHGSTDFADTWAGAATYLETLGYTAGYDTYLLQLYSDFKRDIKLGAPCLLSYTTGNVFSSGHCVFVAGYTETTSYQYLCVVDGWENRYTRYFNYNGFNYGRKKGGALSVAR